MNACILQISAIKKIIAMQDKKWTQMACFGRFNIFSTLSSAYENVEILDDHIENRVVIENKQNRLFKNTTQHVDLHGVVWAVI